MAHYSINLAFRPCAPFLKHGKVVFLFSRSFIKRRLVSREECLKMSRTSKSDFQAILMRMKLSEQWPDFQGSLADVQALKSNCSTLDHLYIRPGNSFAAYHRMELVMQRVKFMSEMGLTPKEKLCFIKKNPPLLVLVKKQFYDSSQMFYVRGILREGTTIKYVFYPVFPRTCARKAVLDERLSELANSLAATKEQVLHITMSLPCFSINSSSLKNYQNEIVHLHMKMLPEDFDLDTHTLDIYPPIFSKRLHHIVQDQSTFSILRGIQFPDLFDVTYNASHGAGCAEDLSEFLLRSHCEEFQYKQPVNFKQKKVPRKHRRFNCLNAFDRILLP